MAYMRLLLAALLLATLGLAACGSDRTGMPGADGEYPVQTRSVSFDGKAYRFMWADASGGLHAAQGRDVKMQQADRTFLEMKGAQPTLHLASEEPVTVQGRDQSGGFTSMWFPFMLGQAMGGIGGGGPPVIINQPSGQGAAYRYPPTDQFGRGDTLHGSSASTKPEAPDYRKMPVAPNAVSGQNNGTGSGSAATGKLGGVDAVQSGQAGGSGTGSAAEGKSVAPAASGQSGGSGTGGAAAGKSAPAPAKPAPAPSRPSTGGKRR